MPLAREAGVYMVSMNNAEYCITRFASLFFGVQLVKVGSGGVGMIVV